MQVRLAREEDLEEVLRLNAQVQELHATAYPEIFKDQADQEALRAHYRDSLKERGEHQLVVAAREEGLGGYLKFQVLVRPVNPFSYSSKHLYVHDLCVDRECRRQGVARALFGFVEDFGKKAKAKDILLDCWLENALGQAAFPALGFEPVRVQFRRGIEAT